MMQLAAELLLVYTLSGVHIVDCTLHIDTMSQLVMANNTGTCYNLISNQSLYALSKKKSVECNFFLNPAFSSTTCDVLREFTHPFRG